MDSQEQDAIDELLEVWRQDGTPFDPVTEGLVGRIVRLSRYFRKLLDESAAPHGLSAEEWEALAVLRRTSSQADATPGRLARDLMLTAGAATARLDRLERKGLVRRKAHPNNRRVVLLELTAAGERAWSRAAAVQQAKEQLVVANLTDRQRQQLNDLLRCLTLAFESREK